MRDDQSGKGNVEKKREEEREKDKKKGNIENIKYAIKSGKARGKPLNVLTPPSILQML